MKTTYQIRNEISNNCDGPITPFVLMSRAAQAVAKGDDAESVANALYSEMSEFGFLVDPTADADR